MNRIEEMFRRLRRARGRALIVYLTVGFPRLQLFPKLVRACEDSGVDLLELGVPFSDPLADGPTIQAASQEALRQGVSLAQVLRQVRLLRRQGIRLPLVLMTYVNPILAYGVKRFCREAAGDGVDGVIVPDLPPEEAGDLVRAARPAGLDTIFLAAPTSSPRRLARIAALSSGFLYYVSLTGVTGARRQLPADVAPHVRAIRRLSRLPVCVGFGVSRPEQVRQVVRVADGAVVGSALLDVIGRSRRNPVSAAKRYLRGLRRACRA